MSELIPAIILAAGKGTRMMHPELPKVLVDFRGRPMIEYLLDAIEQSGMCQKPTLVVGYRQEKVRERLGQRVAYIEQLEQRGTGDAVRAASALLEGHSENVLVFYGDNPFVPAKTIAAFVDAHIQAGAMITLAVTSVPDFRGLREGLQYCGRIVRDDKGGVAGITEYKDATDELRQSRELNTMMYAFNAAWLWSHINQLKNSNAQQEYLITDLVTIAASEGARIGTFSIPVEESYGINSKEELELLEKILEPST